MSSALGSVQSDVDGQSAHPSLAHIGLQVGERRFTTLASTLSEGSSFFASLLSDRWPESRSDDGSYFVDADPDLFAHILRYLRRGVPPIFYNKDQGFDYGLYRALQEEAKYFGIEPLRKWIEEKEYLRAVTIRYSAEEVKGQGIDRGDYNASGDGSIERSYHPFWRTEKVYQCPRGISMHDENPGACGRMCLKAKSEDGDDYVDRDILRTLIVTKRIIFNNVS